MNLSSYLVDSKQQPPGDPTGTETAWLEVGRLEVSSGRIWIGDPCFSWAECKDGSGCVAHVPVGLYLVEAKAQDFSGPRLVTRLRVRLMEADDLTVGKEIGDAGTDSGQMGVCDPDMLMEAFTEHFEDDDEIATSLEDAFDNGCGVYHPDENASGAIVYVPSGFGDGGGPVLAVNSHGKCVGIETEFIAARDAD